MAKKKQAVAESVALAVPDPSVAAVPVGWWEETAMPVIAATEAWDALDELEAQVLTAESFITAKGRDNLELVKALRLIEVRRGELLGAESSQGKLRPSTAEVDAPVRTQRTWRQLARFKNEIVLPALRKAEKPFLASQARLLQLIARHISGGRPKVAAPEGAYHLIYADPPWRYEHVETENRAIENQYPTMSLDDICALKVPAAKDAVLFLWATPPKLAEALRVMAAWGFEYRTGAVWDKEIIGMGYYFRQQHEHLLVGARGSLPVPDPEKRVSSVIRSRRGPHSMKPQVVYRLIESMYPDFGEKDRIELFRRGEARDGWAAWGNEVKA